MITMIVLTICFALFGSLGVALAFMADRKPSKSKARLAICSCACLSLFLFFASGAFLIPLSSVAAKANRDIEERRADYLELREEYVYVVENYPDLVEPLGYDDKIEEFNSHIRYANANKDDPWIGLYVDKAWLGIEEIEL